MTEPVQIVLDTERLAAGLAQLRTDRAAFEGLTITSADMATAVGQLLVTMLRQHDALKAERDRVVMPIHAAYKNASETYAPHLKESEACIAAAKRAIGAWELAELTRKQEAFRLAQAATQVAVLQPETAPEAHAITTAALDVAAAPTGLGKGSAAAGVTTRFEWVFKRVDSPDPRKSMLGSEFWQPNLDAIQAEAERQKKAGTVTNEQPPVIPGVVFELVPSVRGGRK